MGANASNELEAALSKYDSNENHSNKMFPTFTLDPVQWYSDSTPLSKSGGVGRGKMKHDPWETNEVPCGHATDVVHGVRLSCIEGHDTSIKDTHGGVMQANAGLMTNLDRLRSVRHPNTLVYVPHNESQCTQDEAQARREPLCLFGVPRCRSLCLNSTPNPTDGTPLSILPLHVSEVIFGVAGILDAARTCAAAGWRCRLAHYSQWAVVSFDGWYDASIEEHSAATIDPAAVHEGRWLWVDLRGFDLPRVDASPHDESTLRVLVRALLDILLLLLQSPHHEGQLRAMCHRNGSSWSSDTIAWAKLLHALSGDSAPINTQMGAVKCTPTESQRRGQRENHLRFKTSDKGSSSLHDWDAEKNHTRDGVVQLLQWCTMALHLSPLSSEQVANELDLGRRILMDELKDPLCRVLSIGVSLPLCLGADVLEGEAKPGSDSGWTENQSEGPLAVNLPNAYDALLRAVQDLLKNDENVAEYDMTQQKTQWELFYRRVACWILHPSHVAQTAAHDMFAALLPQLNSKWRRLVAYRWLIRGRHPSILCGALRFSPILFPTLLRQDEQGKQHEEVYQEENASSNTPKRNLMQLEYTRALLLDAAFALHAGYLFLVNKGGVGGEEWGKDVLATAGAYVRALPDLLEVLPLDQAPCRVSGKCNEEGFQRGKSHDGHYVTCITKDDNSYSTNVGSITAPAVLLRFLTLLADAAAVSENRTNTFLARLSTQCLRSLWTIATSPRQQHGLSAHIGPAGPLLHHLVYSLYRCPSVSRRRAMNAIGPLLSLHTVFSRDNETADGDLTETLFAPPTMRITCNDVITKTVAAIAGNAVNENMEGKIALLIPPPARDVMAVWLPLLTPLAAGLGGAKWSRAAAADVCVRLIAQAQRACTHVPPRGSSPLGAMTLEQLDSSVTEALQEIHKTIKETPGSPCAVARQIAAPVTSSEKGATEGQLHFATACVSTFTRVLSATDRTLFSAGAIGQRALWTLWYWVHAAEGHGESKKAARRILMKRHLGVLEYGGVMTRLPFCGMHGLLRVEDIMESKLLPQPYY